MNTPTCDSLGPLLIAAHRHAWRTDAPLLDLELGDVVPLLPNLLRSGSVGLVWPRLRHRAAEYGAVAEALEQAYQSQIAYNALCRQRIAQAASRLQSASIDPVLIKGWSLSRRYPEGAVRPAGDIDLVVPASDYDAAREVFYAWEDATGEVYIDLHRDKVRRASSGAAQRTGVQPVGIDLHRHTHWDSQPGLDALQHTTRIPIADGVGIRVLGPEDNLRQLSFHFLWHGATRLVRLCDIALALEQRPRDFDWERCLGRDRLRTNWVITALALAHHLLGARVEDTPVADAVETLPGWLLPVARRQVILNQPPLDSGFMNAVTNPRQLMSVLRARWQDPISATMRLPARFDDAPRFPIQCAVYARIIARYGAHALIPQARQRFLAPRRP